MTPLRKYGTSLLDQEIGIGAQAERDRRATQVRSEAQVAKADAGDFRRARRAYRRAMRNEDTGMAAMALRGMEAFGSAKSAAHGIQSAGWADRVGENNVTRYEFEARKENAIRAKESAEFGISSGSSFAKRAEATAPSSSQAGQSAFNAAAESVDIPAESGTLSRFSDSLADRKKMAADLIDTFRTMRDYGGITKDQMGDFGRRARYLGLGADLGPGFAGRAEQLFMSAVERRDRAVAEQEKTRQQEVQDERFRRGELRGKERAKYMLDQRGLQGAAQEYFRNRSPLKNLDRDINRLDRWERALESGQNQLDAVTGKYITRLGLSRGKTPLFSQR